MSDVTRELTLQLQANSRDVISLDHKMTGTADDIESTLKQSQHHQTLLKRLAAVDSAAAAVDSCHGNTSELHQSHHSQDDSVSMPSVCGHKTLQDAGNEGTPCERLKYRYDESLEMSSYTAPLHHDGAKLLSIHESVELMKQRNQQLEVRSALWHLRRFGGTCS